MKSNVIVKLMGGLGNQLFQYAMGRHLAYINNAQLYMDDSAYKGISQPDSKLGVRLCSLKHFNVKGQFLSAIETTGSSENILNRALSRIQNVLFTKTVLNETPESFFKFNKVFYNYRFHGTVYLVGFWQSEKYFIDIEPFLREELTVKYEYDENNKRLAENISNTDSVCIHIRHGDNANSVAHQHGILPMDYYFRALEIINQNINNPHFYIFSDDIVWAKEQFSNLPHFTFVEHNSDERNYEDMRLISLCKHHVIANSTFSWWGAWLGKKEGQIVFAPKEYYRNKKQPNPDLYPEGWRLL